MAALVEEVQILLANFVTGHKVYCGMGAKVKPQNQNSAGPTWRWSCYSIKNRGAPESAPRAKERFVA